MKHRRDAPPVPRASNQPKPQTARPNPAHIPFANVSPARRVAFQILLAIAAGQEHSDELLHSDRLADLTEPDRHLTTALVMGVLRWQIALDARVRPFLNRPDQVLAEEVALALRLGILQLEHMQRIPPHAALSESVELCRAAGHAHASGMVNAILRKIAAAPPPGKKLYESTTAFAERLGHPLWLVERWVERYGRETALLLCEAGQRQPSQGEMFAARSGAPQDGQGIGDGSDPADTELIENTTADVSLIMDDGSRLVAELTAAVAPATGTPLRVWDACAAPGGKTAVLAKRLPGASILATDVSKRRLQSTEERLKRLIIASSANVRCLVADATRLPEAEGPFDLILCDVPCSGTGTLGRNPEIRHRLTPAEISRQAVRQKSILHAALERLAPGGRLMYSTCSLESEECEEVVETVVSAAPCKLLPMEETLHALYQTGLLHAEIAPPPIQGSALRTLPGVHPCDGFYAVIFERIPA